MGANVDVIFLYLVMSLSCYLHSSVTNGQESELHDPRVRRHLPISWSAFQYTYYMDILIEGYGSSLTEIYLTNTSLLPYTLLMNASAYVSVVLIEITTECNVTGNGTEKMCTCNPGYSWNITMCYTYPPCSNSSNFCSCLFIQDDNIPVCEAPKNISDQRVSLKGYLTTNETFTPDLLDPSSTNYKAKESNLTLALLNAYTKNCNPLSVAVLGFRKCDSQLQDASGGSSFLHATFIQQCSGVSVSLQCHILTAINIRNGDYRARAIGSKLQ